MKTASCFADFPSPSVVSGLEAPLNSCEGHADACHQILPSPPASYSSSENDPSVIDRSSTLIPPSRAYGFMKGIGTFKTLKI